MHLQMQMQMTCYDAPCKSPLRHQSRLRCHAFSWLSRRAVVMQVHNGLPADQLPAARWRKSRVSNPTGSCIEVAELPGGAVAVRNSRDPSGPALIYTRAAGAAFLIGVKDGEVDDLCPTGSVAS